MHMPSNTTTEEGSRMIVAHSRPRIRHPRQAGAVVAGTERVGFIEHQPGPLREAAAGDGKREAQQQRHQADDAGLDAGRHRKVAIGPLRALALSVLEAQLRRRNGEHEDERDDENDRPFVNDVHGPPASLVAVTQR
jgi:hypothetical protein